MRKTALAAGGFALVIALSACGGDETGGFAGTSFSDAQSLAVASDKKTAQSQSAKFTMNIDLPGMKTTANGEARYAGDDTKLAMSLNLQGQAFEMRFVDKKLYMKVPDQMADAAAGKPWIAISPDGTDPVSQAMGGSLNQITEQNDPRKLLDYVKQAGEITSNEQVTLDGQEVMHYEIDLDFNQVAGQMGFAGMAGEQLKQLADKVGTLPMGVWLNGDDLPVQVQMDMAPVMKAAGAPEAQAKGMLTLKYTDWGTDVNIEAPPADQVGTMPSAGN